MHHSSILQEENIQPLTFAQVIQESAKKAGQVFLLAIPGTLILLGVYMFIAFYVWDIIEFRAGEGIFTYLMTWLNNAMVFALGNIYVLYLFLTNQEDSYLHRVKQALIKTCKKIPVVFLASLLYAVIVMVGFTLLIIPGLLLFTYFGLYAHTVAFEHKGVISSLSRSRQLLKGSFWRMFVLLAGTLLLYTVVLFLISFVIESYIPFFSPPFWLDTLLFVLMCTLAAPFVGSIYTVIYFELRSRQEAFDYEAFEYEKEKLMADM